MAILRTLTETWHRHAPATVRLRLTMLYSGLFLALGAVLLAITYGLVARQLSRRGGPGGPALPEPPALAPPGRLDNLDAFRQRLEQALAAQRAQALDELLTQSILALAIVSVIAIVLGWMMAGRTLPPLRDITATAARRLRITQTLHSAPVRGDPVLLERLATNLIGNAVQHNVPTGWIDLRTASNHTAATLRITNGGPPIPPDSVEELFEPFRRRAPERTTGNHGHGLGLSIVAAIVAAHHAALTAHAQPDGGLDIVITLPTDTVGPPR